MRTNGNVAALSLAFLIGACGTRQEERAALPDDLARDLAIASASGIALGVAPQSYQRMRFVSDIEQSRASVRARRPKVAHATIHPAVSHRPADDLATDVAPDPVVADVTESPAPEPVGITEAPLPEQSAVSIPRPSSEPASGPAETVSEPGVGESGRGGGLGGLLGGIIGAVVIRGGHGGTDKCDPRTDGRARPTVTGRPDFGMPLPIGRPTFPGSRGR